MSNQARVGLFTLIGLFVLIYVFYVVADLGSRRGYQIGVHFSNVAGLKTGGYVMQQGVIIGNVANVTLLPDYTVEVTLNIGRQYDIPSNAEFIIQSPITGDPYLNIRLPRRPRSTPPAPPLPHEILPLAQQPEGKAPVTLADLVATGQSEAERIDRMLADIERREPQIIDQLEQSASNVNALTGQMRGTIGDLATRSNAMASQLQENLGTLSQNLVAMSATLRSTVDAKSGKIAQIVDNLNAISESLMKSADSVQKLAADPRMHDNVIQTTTELKNTAHSIAGIAEDLHQLTDNPQTQAQLHDTVANIDASAQRMASILAKFGGRSSVYGVDAGATPVPPRTPAPPVPGSPSRGGSSTKAPQETSSGHLLGNLFAVKLRFSELSKTNRSSFDTPVLSRDRGPQSDLDLWFAPDGSTSLELGANDIGGYTTVNAAVFKRVSSRAHLGGGVFYSRLGVAGSADAGPFGLDALLYDLRHPTLDLYGRVKVMRGLSGFIGERDILGGDRRPVFGLELGL